MLADPKINKFRTNITEQALIQADAKLVLVLCNYSQKINRHGRNLKIYQIYQYYYMKYINFVPWLSGLKAIENECHFPTPCKMKKKKLEFLKCQRKPQLLNPKILQLKIRMARDSTKPFEKKDNFQYKILF